LGSLDERCSIAAACLPQITHFPVDGPDPDRPLLPAGFGRGYRFRIELGFRQAVHVLGAYAYHFWMRGMKPLKRGDGDQVLHRTCDAYRAAIRRKMAAFHVHVQLGCIAQGLLQHLSLNYTAEVWLGYRSWLRTLNPTAPPSELVAANALRATIPGLFAPSLLESKLKKILNQYRRSDIHLDSQEIAA
jgi:hypothetical protein